MGPDFMLGCVVGFFLAFGVIVFCAETTRAEEARINALVEKRLKERK